MTQKSRAIVAISCALAFDLVFVSCGRDTIDLARSTQAARPEAGIDAGACGVECARFGGVCIPELGRCAQCKTDGECSSLAFTKHCDTSTHSCVVCLDKKDCVDVAAPWALVFGASVLDLPWSCGPVTKVCTTECESKLDCPLFIADQCDVDGKVCVQCTSESQCGIRAVSGDPTAVHCAAGRCVQCTSDAECTGRHCSPRIGRCVGCYLPEHCDAGHECDVESSECISRD
jgi:hypothetical protein